MEEEVNALMGATDEALWKRVGLFTSVDVLCSGTTPSNSTLIGLALQTKNISEPRDEATCVPHPTPIFLSGVFDFNQSVDKIISERVLDGLGREKGSLFSKGKEFRVIGRIRGRRKQWKPNK